MRLRRFREPCFSGYVGNRPEPLCELAQKSLVAARFLVPGTVRNRQAHNGSRFFPSLDGNRDQCQLFGVSR
jgi:hypothetical protein